MSVLLDEDTIVDLHLDDELSCVRGDTVATARLVARCCGAYVLLCDGHLDENRIMARFATRATCKACRTVKSYAFFDDLYRVVPL